MEKTGPHLSVARFIIKKKHHHLMLCVCMCVFVLQFLLTVFEYYSNK